MPYKRFRKRRTTPRKPWDVKLLEEELRQIGQYGLRSKRELRRTKWVVARYRSAARRLSSLEGDSGERMKKEFLAKLYEEGLIEKGTKIGEVLDLSVEDFLERRLQTVVFKKGLAKTIHQARQLITHGHIAVNGRRVSVPSFTVRRDLENKIAYLEGSPVNNPKHPVRKVLGGKGE